MPIGSIKAKCNKKGEKMPIMFQCQLVQLKPKDENKLNEYDISSNANWFN